MQHQSLDQQLIEYRQKRALAMPVSGMIVWTLLFILSFILPASQMVMATFIGTGSIVYLAMGVSRLTGENISFKKSTDRNWFETVFLAAMGMSFLTFSISIPFFMENYLALPFALAVQTGLMWLVFGVLAAQKVAIVHAIVRTVACVAAFMLWPELSFQLQPLIVVVCYGFSIPLMERRWKIQQNLCVAS
ncbi:DUF7010 family protein [Shewanella xiamenensis]|uniref:DUF7010 family protein n=1 Tax=Shewanella xiamenensis TaxID=332186 RepID=UPI001668D192|nr:hypothetical protein [Shewanella xiamenensis]MCL1071177.1 hypothetical protein [Shewanella xiamenensis]MCR4534666.1 hypothetical protein [Shewanella xiamenensis]WHF55063.1 hypothetical protein OCF84_16945 [Shewanella xiamenensis]GGM77730.1 hypothetical protein GCM10009124_00630 [Shewanella xiamenensis]